MTSSPVPSAFQQRLTQIAIDSLVSASIALGRKLGLFEALAKVGNPERPATPGQVADAAGCKERYVKEWLSVLACSDIIEVNEDEKFWIKPENVADLLGSTGLVFNAMNNVLVKPFDQLTEVFRKSGPLGMEYSQFGEFYDMMGKLSESLHAEHMFTELIPLIGQGIKEKLENGPCLVLDVGCGKGFHAALLAENYPKSNFTGIDITHDVIVAAKQKRKPDGTSFDNLEFIQMNAGKMDDNWAKKFDFVLIFDACHDQMRPDLCLKEIYRVLKPGGVFAMIEIAGSSNVYKDRAEKGALASMFYGASMFHCLPVGSNCPDALCLGAMWGQVRAQKLISDAGFEKIDVIATPFFPVNVLYRCTK